MNAPAPRLVIVTGLSGSGKSTALHALEDLGYYCVDNLPLALLEAFGEQMCSAPRSYGRAAVGLDVRTSADFGQLPDLLPLLAAKGIETRVVALSADERTLLNRYKETRRRHPLASATTTLGVSAVDAARPCGVSASSCHAFCARRGHPDGSGPHAGSLWHADGRSPGSSASSCATNTGDDRGDKSHGGGPAHEASPTPLSSRTNAFRA